MQCVVNIPIELERLLIKKDRILANLGVSHHPNRIAWLNMQLNDVNKSIREYHRSH